MMKITIDNKRLIIPEIRHVFYGAAGAEYLWFITGMYFETVILIGYKSLDLLMQMVGIDDYGVAAGPLQPADPHLSSLPRSSLARPVAPGSKPREL